MNAILPLTRFKNRLRASKTVVAIPRCGQILFYNFLTKSAVFTSLKALYWISLLQEWTALDEITASHLHLDETSIEIEFQKLVESGVLVVEQSDESQREEHYLESWEWGLAAGIFHFSVLNNEFLGPSEALTHQLQRKARDPSPCLYWRNEGNVVSFNRSRQPQAADLLRTMEARRTNRSIAGATITKDQLGDCLYAGMAITGHVETPTGLLPLGMTPSGGARNPFEAFVLVRNVSGLARGVYHYSAIDDSITLISSTLPNHPSDLLAKQEWADEMPAIILLVAVLERTMWKYPDANGYRVVLIEAGHIGQNIMLAATAHGLSACPTAALDHDLISRYLGLEKITHSPIYALTLSEPGDYDANTLPV